MDKVMMSECSQAMKNRLIELQELVNEKQSDCEPQVTLTIWGNQWCLQLVSMYIPSDQNLVFVDENGEAPECDDNTTIVADEDFNKACDKFVERLKFFDQGYHLD